MNADYSNQIMKFAKELEQELVPEWKAKYVDYKGGKKRIKKIAQAVKKARATPKTPGSNLPAGILGTPLPQRTPLSQLTDSNDDAYFGADAISQDPDRIRRLSEPAAIPERQVLKNSPESKTHRYGSISKSTPHGGAPPLNLPAPAMNLGSNSADATQSAFEVGKTTSPKSKNPFGRQPRPQQKSNSQVAEDSPRNFLHRIASSTWNRASPRSDAELQAIDLVTASERAFFKWMDGELEKVDGFYKQMEAKNEERLRVLREQLHQFHARRLQELTNAQRDNDDSPADLSDDQNNSRRFSGNGAAFPNERIANWLGPLGKTFGPHPGRNSRHLQQLAASPGIFAKERDSRYVESGRDYVQRRPVESEGPNYRTAKRRLKIAMQEFYRGLELLKSYALLNRTAFRKINKKYDKAVDAREPLKYVSEKVNKSYFCQSEKTEAQIHTVEDLYSRYFEGGKHKVAVGKLRTSTTRRPDYYLYGISNGLMVGIGSVFAIQGLIFAIQLLLNSPDPTIRGETSYLLQLYGGYFLCLYLFSWFCFDCMVWTKHKINYQFVFEFDPRHRLDWQELINFPSFFLLLLGLFLWVNFSGYGIPTMFIYYPVILIGVTLAIIFFPLPELFYKSRQWFLYSHWRLLCSITFWYTVEFRDFFLGDMYGSLTYATSNIELFFCLYIPTEHWLSPGQCNSSSPSYHGRLLGFCSALPAIWRACQCLRRYRDSGDAYPHLANCGKYIMTIVYYVTLSLFRIHDHPATKSAFVVFAAFNAVYVTFWDLVNDWSLCQPDASPRFLRDTRGFKRTWWYYAAMIIDPIFRFNWIFYAIYTHNAGHASLVSFLVAFSEVTRRGIWTLFRVENEHCTNVGHYRAYRDIALPYKLEGESTEDVGSAAHEGEEPAASRSRRDGSGTGQQTSPAGIGKRSDLQGAAPDVATGTGSMAQQTAPVPGQLKRRPTGTWTQMLAEGHAKDFVKKKPEDRPPVDLEMGRRYLDSDDESDSDSPQPQSAERRVSED